MLSENDVHYIAGLLHAVTRHDVKQIVLGERIWDAHSETRRDVDIVVLQAGNTEMVGVEVKDESRALDVSIVEGLRLKLRDMPQIAERAIVSASGFSEPARRKAHSHGVACLTFVRGAAPAFDTIDISRLQTVTVLNPCWIAGPHVIFAPDEELTLEERSDFSTGALLFSDAGEQVSAGDLAVQFVDAALAAWTNPNELGPVRVDVRVEVKNAPILKLTSRDVRVAAAQVKGVLRWQPETKPLAAACYLEDEWGKPFAATAIIEAVSGLFALAVSSETNKIAVFRIPDSIRKHRPHRYIINPTA